MANVTKLYVGNLAENVTQKDLKNLFGNFGQVDEVAVLRGFGFVHFRNEEDATSAMKSLDDTEFMGSHIQVQVSRSRGPKFESRGGGRGDSGGHYRDSYYFSGSSSSGRDRSRYDRRTPPDRYDYRRYPEHRYYDDYYADARYYDDRYSRSGYREREDRYGGGGSRYDYYPSSSRRSRSPYYSSRDYGRDSRDSYRHYDRYR